MSTSRPELNTDQSKKLYTVKLEDGTIEEVSEKVFKTIVKLTTAAEAANLGIMVMDMQIKRLQKEAGRFETNTPVAENNDEASFLKFLSLLSSAEDRGDKLGRKPSYSRLFSGKSSSSSDSEEGIDIAQLLAEANVNARRPR